MSGHASKRLGTLQACQACRHMKIRCDRGPTECQVCKQCAKVGRDCIELEPKPKGRRPKMHRNGRLEKSSNELRESVMVQPLTTGLTLLPSVHSYSNSTDIESDVISRGLVQESSAYAAFQRFHNDMSQYVPVVVFPPNILSGELRRQKPILFLSILCAALGKFDPQLQVTLIDELTRVLADRVICRGERSLELVQALLVRTLFYTRPKNSTGLNFNLLINIAATMALDLGMGKRTKATHLEEATATSINDIRRAWLGCYFMCANSAMSLRQPPYLRWSAHNEECLEGLRASSEALPSDSLLIHIVKLQHICGDAGIVNSMDDPAAIVSLADLRTQFHLSAFESRLSKLQSEVKESLNMLHIRHVTAVMDLYVHEVAIHLNHDIDDFQPKNTEMGHPVIHEDFFLPARIDAFLKCQRSIHSVFDSLFKMDVETIRDLPTLYFVRSTYAAVALVRAARILNLLNRQATTAFDLRVEYHLDAAIETLGKAAAEGKSIAGYRFGLTFKRLRDWYTKEFQRPQVFWETAGRFVNSNPDPGPDNIDYNQSQLLPPTGVPEQGYNSDVYGLGTAWDISLSEFGDIDFTFSEELS